MIIEVEKLQLFFCKDCDILNKRRIRVIKQYIFFAFYMDKNYIFVINYDYIQGKMEGKAWNLKM